MPIDYDAPELRMQSALVQRRHRSLSPAAQRFVQLLHEVESEWVDAEAAARTAARGCGRADQLGVGVPAMRSYFRKYWRAMATSWFSVGRSMVSQPTICLPTAGRCLST